MTIESDPAHRSSSGLPDCDQDWLLRRSQQEWLLPSRLRRCPQLLRNRYSADLQQAAGRNKPETALILQARGACKLLHPPNDRYFYWLLFIKKSDPWRR